MGSEMCIRDSYKHTNSNCGNSLIEYKLWHLTAVMKVFLKWELNEQEAKTDFKNSCGEISVVESIKTKVIDIGPYSKDSFRSSESIT